MDDKAGFDVMDSHAEFRRMYTTSLPIIYGFVFLRVGGDKSLAEDLTAEAFAAAAQEYRAGRAEIVTISWLRTVAKRRVIDHWRHQRMVLVKTSPTTPSEVDPEPDITGRQMVLDTLDQLSKHERTALLLQHIDGYAVNEIAEIIGRTEKATESLLSRARSAFRASYTEAEHG